MNPTCDKPGCGLEMQFKAHANLFRRNFGGNWVCPRNADAHALCRKLAESEAKVKELTTALFHTRCPVDAHEIEGAECSRCTTLLKIMEARKRGAEHGE